MTKKDILAFAGSTRTDSVNKKLLANAVAIAKQLGGHVTKIDLRDHPLPLYDGDLEIEQGFPKNAQYIQDLMLKSSIILIASPEYNSSLSGVLKNTIDWVSRNGEAEGFLGGFKGKTFVIMSASPSKRGGERGLVHLKSILENVGGRVVPQQVIVPNAYEAFNEKGDLKDPLLQQQLEALIKESFNF